MQANPSRRAQYMAFGQPALELGLGLGKVLKEIGLGKPLFEMHCFHMGNAQIALDPIRDPSRQF